MDDLKELLDISNLNEIPIPDRFKKIAETLMGNYIIKKGKKKYAFTEIEFYLYTPKHQDFITYYRNMSAGRWWFHPSGVDLTFKTEGTPELVTLIDEKGKKIHKWSYCNCSFGGLLIRGLYLLEENTDTKGIKRDNYIFGPRKCVDILWDNFYAFKNSDNEYPIIEEATDKEKTILQKFPLRYSKRCINVENKEEKIEEWAKRIVVKVKDYYNETKLYSNELFESKDKYLYRFFNLLSPEDPKDLTKIQPIEARPQKTYRLEE